MRASRLEAWPLCDAAPLCVAVSIHWRQGVRVGGLAHHARGTPPLPLAQSRRGVARRRTRGRARRAQELDAIRISVALTLDGHA